MRKVIGFSLWGEQEHYYYGALENIDLAKEFYPGWECWFYIQNQEHKDPLIKTLISEIERKAKVISYCTNNEFEGSMIRFLPALEKDVSVFISRDCDSRLNVREQYAVNEWLNETTYPFHLMRDHKEHQTEILAGMWGCRDGVLHDLQLMFDQWTDYTHKGIDQEFLTKFVWPRIKNNHLAHDSYDYSTEPAIHYRWKEMGDIRRFPAHPPMKHGTFVGEQFQ